MIPSVHIRPVPTDSKITIRPHGNGRFRVTVEPRLDREPPPAIYSKRNDADATSLAFTWRVVGPLTTLRRAAAMQTAATITVNRQALEAIIQELIDLIDTADRVAAIDAEKAAQEAEA